MSTTLLEKKIKSKVEIKPEITYSKLNIEDENEVIEFEKALYKEFMERNPDSLVVTSYINIDNCRFKIPRNYKDLGIYIVKKNRKIIMGIGINFNMEIELQLEKRGFKNFYKDDETAEALFFFSVQSELKGLNFFEIADKLFIMAKNDFTKEKLIKRIYGTCSKKLLNMYDLMDFQPVQKIILEDGKEKYLLCCFI